MTKADVWELFPRCLHCGNECTDELETVLATERPYRVAHSDCQRAKDRDEDDRPMTDAEFFVRVIRPGFPC